MVRTLGMLRISLHAFWKVSPQCPAWPSRCLSPRPHQQVATGFLGVNSADCTGPSCLHGAGAAGTELLLCALAFKKHHLLRLQHQVTQAGLPPVSRNPPRLPGPLRPMWCFCFRLFFPIFFCRWERVLYKHWQSSGKVETIQIGFNNYCKCSANLVNRPERIYTHDKHKHTQPPRGCLEVGLPFPKKVTGNCGLSANLQLLALQYSCDGFLIVTALDLTQLSLSILIALAFPRSSWGGCLRNAFKRANVSCWGWKSRPLRWASRLQQPGASRKLVGLDVFSRWMWKAMGYAHQPPVPLLHLGAVVWNITTKFRVFPSAGDLGWVSLCCLAPYDPSHCNSSQESLRNLVKIGWWVQWCEDWQIRGDFT